MTAEIPAVIEFQGVSKRFCEFIDLSRKYAVADMVGRGRAGNRPMRTGEFYALRNLSFTIRRGEVVLLAGGAESGKSTVVQLTAGMLLPDEGSVRVRGRVALVTAGRWGADPLTTVEEHLRLAAALVGVAPEAGRRMAEEVLDFSGMKPWRRSKLHDLPRGMAPALNFCVGLRSEADILLIEDFISIKDEELRKKCMEALKSFLGARTAVVLARTPKALPAGIDRVLLLHSGEVVAEGPPDQLVPVFARMTRAPGEEGPKDDTRTEAIDQMTEVMDRMSEKLDKYALIQGASEWPEKLEGELDRLLHAGRPILLGPWFGSEVYEALYWIPFLNWISHRYLLEPERLMVVSREGACDWYAHLARHYLDLSDLVSPEEFSAAGGAGTKKQLRRERLDDLLVDRARAKRGWSDCGVLHPSWLFRLLVPIWRELLPMNYLLQHSIYRSLSPPPGPVDGLILPRRYAVVGWEFNPYLEDTPATRRRLSDLIAGLSRELPVVVLVPAGIGTAGIPAAPGAPVTVVDLASHPGRSIGIQGRVLAGARVFVGPMAGACFVAPFYGVDAIALCDDLVRVRERSQVVPDVVRELGGRRFEPARLADLTVARVLDGRSP